MGDGGLLLQLVNEHLYRKPGDKNEDFMLLSFLETTACAIKQFQCSPEFPEVCFRFERPSM